MCILNTVSIQGKSNHSGRPSTAAWVSAMLWASEHRKHWVCFWLPNVSNQLATHASHFPFGMTGGRPGLAFSSQ